MDDNTPKQTASSRTFPWWVSVTLAALSYAVLKYLIPALPLESPALQKLSQAAPTFAPLAAIPFLLLAAKQLYDTDSDEQPRESAKKSKEEDQEEEHRR